MTIYMTLKPLKKEISPLKSKFYCNCKRMWIHILIFFNQSYIFINSKSCFVHFFLLFQNVRPRQKVIERRGHRGMYEKLHEYLAQTLLQRNKSMRGVLFAEQRDGSYRNSWLGQWSFLR